MKVYYNKNTSDIDIAIFENIEKEDEYNIRNQFDLLDIIYKIDLVFIDKDTKKEFLEEIKKGRNRNIMKRFEERKVDLINATNRLKEVLEQEENDLII